MANEIKKAAEVPTGWVALGIMIVALIVTSIHDEMAFMIGGVCLAVGLIVSVLGLLKAPGRIGAIIALAIGAIVLALHWG